jgi:hypothetical protein
MSEQFVKINSNINSNLKKLLESVKTLNERVKNKEYNFENVNF